MWYKVKFVKYKKVSILCSSPVSTGNSNWSCTYIEFDTLVLVLVSLSQSLPPSLFLPFARSFTRSQWKRVIQGLVLQKVVLKLEARQNKQMQQIYALKLTHADETDWKHSESRRRFGNLQWSTHPHLWLTERLWVKSNKHKINLISTNINTLTIKYYGISLYSGHLPSWQEKIVKVKFHNKM